MVLPCPSDPADRAKVCCQCHFSLCLSVGHLRGTGWWSSLTEGWGWERLCPSPWVNGHPWGLSATRQGPVRPGVASRGSSEGRPMHPHPRLAQDDGGSPSQGRPSRMAKGRREPALSLPGTHGFGVRLTGMWAAKVMDGPQGEIS